MEQLQLFATPVDGSQVYLGMRGGVLEIGVTRQPPAKRARDLGIDLLGVIPGGRDLERQLHAEFDRYRTRGEWFIPDIRILRRFGVRLSRPNSHPSAWVVPASPLAAR